MAISPRSWQTQHNREFKGLIRIADAGGKPVAIVLNASDAAFITLACNSYERVLKELHDMIDGGEECRGRDSGISRIIRIMEGSK